LHEGICLRFRQRAEISLVGVPHDVLAAIGPDERHAVFALRERARGVGGSCEQQRQRQDGERD